MTSQRWTRADEQAFIAAEKALSAVRERRLDILDAARAELADALQGVAPDDDVWDEYGIPNFVAWVAESPRNSERIVEALTRFSEIYFEHLANE